VVPPEVESWRVDAPTRPCAFCRSNVEGKQWTTCPRCATVYHPDCWASNSRRCAVYGCEPGLTPATIHARPVRPVLQPPDLPRSGMNMTWLLPILAIFVINVARYGMSGTSSPPSRRPPSTHLLNEVRPADVEALREVPEPVLPALPEDVPAMVDAAQRLEASASALQSVPGGRLTVDVRRMLRERVLADLASLQQALKLYRRCAAAQPDAEIRNHVDRVQTTIGRKRSLLLDLMRARGTD
jgi:hypothetical protein